MLIRYFVERNNAVGSPYIEATIGYLTPTEKGEPEFVNFKCKRNAFEKEVDAETAMINHISSLENDEYKDLTNLATFYSVKKYYIREPVEKSWNK